MKATLKEIARKAGTSAATVSMVLNGRNQNRISEETWTRIKKIADELQYHPNLKARALVQGKTRNLAIIINEADNPFYIQYFTLLQEWFESQAYTVFSFETKMDPARERHILEWAEQGYFDGVLCLEYNASNREAYEGKQKIPVVFRGWAGSSLSFVPKIGVDYRNAVRLLFRHLEEQGWKHLAVSIDAQEFSSERDSRSSVRRALYEESLHGLKLSLNDERCMVLPQKLRGSLRYIKQQTMELLRKHPETDAILSASAQHIPAVYKAVEETGRIIGKDIAVAAFDRIPLLEFLTPEVTHIMEPEEAISDALAHTLLARLNGKEPLEYPAFHAELKIQNSTLRRSY